MSNCSHNPRVNVIVALPCEAKPLVRHYQLTRVQDVRGFTVYTRGQQDYTLIVSGVGPLRAAAAVGYLAGYYGHNPAAYYLNIGVAGHKSLSVGDCRLINKIYDTMNQKEYYPSVGAFRQYPMASLETRAVGELGVYPDNNCVDMEAAAIFSTAERFVSREHVQVLKIISDNAEYHAELTVQYVEQLLTDNLAKITEFIEKLYCLSRDELSVLDPLSEWVQFIEQWHFSQYQQHQLKQLLAKFQIVKPGFSAFRSCADLSESKQVLAKLALLLAEHNYEW